ncbi:MAG: hypothetical protein CMLOHMNK_00116 [Steroidobacteraceae bacterium]|nr:hypothetical protein [Steroidobacteraceae bacterium]
MKLPELQQHFIASLYGESSDIEAQVRGDHGIGAAGRMAIYRYNLQAGFGKALALEFPVIAALCGADYFARLAREFQLAHPSTSGDLHHIGAPFPRYLRQRFESGDYAYFADVAELEWAREEAARAADGVPFDVGTLGTVAPEDTPALRFAFQPAVRLVVSRWPILSIWEAHQAPGEVRPVDPGASAGAEHVLVRRAATGPVLERVGEAEFSWLASLLRGAPLGEAFDAALAIDAAFDVAMALQRCVARGLFRAACG